MRTLEAYKAKDAELFAEVQKLKDGKTGNYNRIYELSEKYIYKIIYDIVKNHHTTEDLMQETFLQIYNKISGLQNAEAFYVWAGRIATNLTLRYIQKNRHEVLVTADSEGETDFVFETAAEDMENFIPESILMNKEKQRLIGEIIDGFSIEQKLSVQYFYYEEMSVREIAQTMGCSEGTVKSRLNYARKSLKDAVIDLDVNKNTRLYSLSELPLFLLLFRHGVESFIIAGAGAGVGAAGVAGAAGSGTAGTSGAGAAGAAGSAAAKAVTIFGTTVSKTTVIAIATAATIVVGGAAVAVGMNGPHSDEPQTTVEASVEDEGEENTPEIVDTDNSQTPETETEEGMEEPTETEEPVSEPVESVEIGFKVTYDVFNRENYWEYDPSFAEIRTIAWGEDYEFVSANNGIITQISSNTEPELTENAAADFSAEYDELMWEIIKGVVEAYRDPQRGHLDDYHNFADEYFTEPLVLEGRTFIIDDVEFTQQEAGMMDEQLPGEVPEEMLAKADLYEDDSIMVWFMEGYEIQFTCHEEK